LKGKTPRRTSSRTSTSNRILRKKGKSIVSPKEGWRMKMVLIMVSIFFFVGLALAPHSNAAGLKAKGGGMTYETFDLRGTYVTNPKGEGLGRISDFVIDREGRIILAVLYREGNVANEDGKYVAVPFNALSISEPRPHDVKVVLKVAEEKIAMAPRFDVSKGLADRQSAADIYRYYGQQPYWSEKSPMKNPGANSPW
jgi:hypothetical protein